MEVNFREFVWLLCCCFDLKNKQINNKKEKKDREHSIIPSFRHSSMPSFRDACLPEWGTVSAQTDVPLRKILPARPGLASAAAAARAVAATRSS